MKFRKRPVVIEAELFEPLMGRLPAGVRVWSDEHGTHGEIETLEGVMRATPGDWIITGVNGERYPCKPDIFAKTYEPAE